MVFAPSLGIRDYREAIGTKGHFIVGTRFAPLAVSKPHVQVEKTLWRPII
jgi:hypothetical protein